MLNNRHRPDWKLIDDISLSLLEEGIGNYDVLQKALPSIVLSKINETSNDCTVERLLKMFRIAQLQIEYVLKHTEFLRWFAIRVDAANFVSKKMNLKTQAELVKQVEDLQNRLKFVSAENSKLRKELISGTETINSLFKCDRCDKLFLHSTFLYDHMKRRHKDEQHGDNE